MKVEIDCDFNAVELDGILSCISDEMFDAQEGHYPDKTTAEALRKATFLINRLMMAVIAKEYPEFSRA